MRDLIYKEPRKLTQVTIEDGKRLDNPAPEYYSRFSVLYTKYGVVTVLEFDWKTNFGQSRFAEFRTMHNGLLYSADLNEVRLNDRCLRWMATHFAKTIKSR